MAHAETKELKDSHWVKIKQQAHYNGPQGKPTEGHQTNISTHLNKQHGSHPWQAGTNILLFQKSPPQTTM